MATQITELSLRVSPRYTLSSPALEKEVWPLFAKVTESVFIAAVFFPGTGSKYRVVIRYMWWNQLYIISTLYQVFYKHTQKGPLFCLNVLQSLWFTKNNFSEIQLFAKKNCEKYLFFLNNDSVLAGQMLSNLCHCPAIVTIMRSTATIFSVYWPTTGNLFCAPTLWLHNICCPHRLSPYFLLLCSLRALRYIVSRYRFL